MFCRGGVLVYSFIAILVIVSYSFVDNQNDVLQIFNYDFQLSFLPNIPSYKLVLELHISTYFHHISTYFQHISTYFKNIFTYFMIKQSIRPDLGGGRGAGPHQKSARGGEVGRGGSSLPRIKVKKKISKCPKSPPPPAPTI